MISKLYKYRDFNTNYWESIFHDDGAFWFSIAKELDDEDEAAIVTVGVPMPSATQVYVRQIQASVSLLSLSLTPRSEDCWIRYGDNGSGFCIEIDFSSYEDPDGEYPLYKVDYIDEPAIASLHPFDSLKYRANEEEFIEKISRRLFFEKNVKWADQQEVRVMHYNLNPCDGYRGHSKKFGVTNLKKVFYREQINPSNLDALKKVLSDVKVNTGHTIELSRLK